MKNSKLKYRLWHSFKALACIGQLYLIDKVANQAVDDLLFELVEIKSLGYALLPFFADVVIFLALWWYYDHIDDISFHHFCTVSPPPTLLRDEGFVIGHILSSLGAVPIMALALYSPLTYTHLMTWACVAISLGVATIFVTSASLLRIRILGSTWSIQKDLRSQKEKKYRLFGRVIYALIYFGSLVAFVYCGIAIFLPIFGTLLSSIWKLLRIPFLIFVGILIVLDVVRYLRHIRERKQFMLRLYTMRDKGILSFEIHGHPYLSVFGYNNQFHLTITHHPQYDNKTDNVTYKIAVANCHRRRLTVVLCDHQIYQFMYSINIRIIRGMRGGLGMMGPAGVHTMRSMALPAFTFFINHSFDFPKGDGQRILLIDPAPYVLYLRGMHQGEYQLLDNSASVYDYIVYGKNPFLNLLERT